MKKATISLYELNELSEKAKRKAIEDERYFLLSEMRLEDFISGDPKHDTREELKKAYEDEYYHISINDEPIIETIEINDYLFFADGTLANTQYNTTTGNMFLKLNGENIPI